jgi:hypothetical protein
MMQHFITCEYLIAYDGRIMLSHNNILHYHSSRLPDKIIIMANVSQIVNNLNDAMGKIKRNGNIKNLTSISGSQSKWILLPIPIQNCFYCCLKIKHPLLNFKFWTKISFKEPFQELFM